MTRPTFVTFAGGWGPGPMGRLMAGAQAALTLDLLEVARNSGGFDGCLLVTDMPELAAETPSGVTVECDTGEFHFGQRLREIVERYDIARPFYLGGGSGPLVTAEELAEIARQLADADSVVLTNNFASADLVAFTPGSALSSIDLPASDNPLPRLLQRQAGLQVVNLPRTTATMFDIDTPTDLLILGMHPEAGPHVRSYLGGMPDRQGRLREAMMYLTDPAAEILVAGRAGSYLWAHLEKETACRVRFIAEERGMQAAGRDRPGAVHSVLGHYVEAAGLERFFAMLGTLGQAVFLDTRVLFYHLGLDPSAEDRFASDLGLWETIAEPTIRAFTRAALDAPVPVVLGGHSLVAGGLMALVDAAWLEHDRLTGKAPPSQ